MLTDALPPTTTESCSVIYIPHFSLAVNGTWKWKYICEWKCRFSIDLMACTDQAWVGDFVAGFTQPRPDVAIAEI